MIAEFLKGTVSERLEKLVQPSGWIPALVLLLLNLGFIYPAALAQGSTLAASFHDLDGAWKAALVAAVLVGIGYLLVASATPTLDFMSGLRASKSVAFRLLRALQQRQLTALDRSIADADVRATDALRWQRALVFPTSSTSTVDPAQQLRATALGNAFTATQARVADRYGIELAALWTHAEASTKLKEAPALVAVKEERAAIELLANLALVLALFALESLLYFLFEGQPRSAVLAQLALIPAYISYRAAVTKARSWGTGVDTLLDLHRHELWNELGLPELPDSNLHAERHRWEAVSNFLLPGALVAGADPFAALPPPTATASDVVSVKAIHSTPHVRPAPSSGACHMVAELEYLLLLEPTESAQASRVARVLVQDERLRTIDATPTATTSEATATAEIVGVDGAPAILWQIKDFQVGRSISLKYRLPLVVIKTIPDAEVAAPSVTGIKITPSSDASLTITLIAYSSPVTPPSLMSGLEARSPDAVEGASFTWEVEKPQAGWPQLWLRVGERHLEAAAA